MKSFTLLNRITIGAIIAVLTVTMVDSRAFAQSGGLDMGAFDTNEVLFYDPTDSAPCSGTSGTGAATTSVDGADNAEKIYNYLVAKGLSGAQAAGVLGNFQQESGFNPAIIQGGQIADANYKPQNGVGFGIAQWTFTVRQQPLVDLANSTNRKVIDLAVQLDYLWKELNGTHKHALTTLRAATTPEDAAYVFHRDFEASADSEATVKAKRGGPAREWYDKFDGSQDLGDASSLPNDSSSSVRCGAGNGVGDFTADGFSLFNQCDEPWGSMAVPSPTNKACAVACGPTAMAMIIKNMTGADITPTDTIKYTTENNLWFGTSGTTPQAMVSLGRNWNVSGKQIKGPAYEAGIKDALSKGGLVMTMGLGSKPYLVAPPHWVVIRGITEDGKYMVADPNGNSGNYDINEFISNTSDAWVFTKG